MAKGANMKVNMTADNSDLVRKSKESKQALKDFEKVGDDALSRLGEAFGVNTGKIEQMSSALRGLGIKMSESGNAGVAAFGKLLTSVGGLSTAIAGIGIGAVVAGFKMLNDEAENFKNTVAGANMEMATTAYIDTYRQVIHDFNREVGKSFAETTAKMEKTTGTFWSKLGASIATGAFSGAPGYAGVANINTQQLETYNNLLTEAGQKARAAEEISNEMYQVTRQISDKTVEWARMEREIAEYKRIAYDKTSSTAQQQEALNKAVELITQKYGEQAELQGKLADLQEEFNSLAESSVADIDKANQLRVQAENVTASMNNALRELSERQASVAANAKKEAEARKEALAAAQAMAAARANLQGWDGSISSENNLKDSLPTQMTAPDAGIAVPVTPVLDASAVTDITNELQSVLTSAFDSIGSALGSLIGDLITGEDAWGNFGNAALSAFGDMATTIGKMAISIGVATLAIQGSLTTLNGWAAIAAGTALVALGMAVKTGLSNIASGNYSASASVATSGNYGSSTNVGMAFDQRELNIKVSGKLYASGNQIMAVIENENNRINHTT
jgi:hypothetical protein